MGKLRVRFTYANVISTLCLFVLLGGASYAAFKLPKNSVGSKQIRKNAVNSAKVKDGSLLAGDFKPGQIPAGKEGPPGPKGDPGATNAVVRYGDKVIAGDGSSAASFAACKAGEKVTGGGWAFPTFFPINAKYAVTFSEPARTIEIEPGLFEHVVPVDGSPATGWFVSLENETGSSFEFLAYVMCASP